MRECRQAGCTDEWSARTALDELGTEMEQERVVEQTEQAALLAARGTGE